MSRPQYTQQAGFDYFGNQQGSSAQLDNIVACLSKVELDNAQLSLELQALHSKMAISAYGAHVDTSTNPAKVHDLENQLSVHGSSGDLETITLGSQTFKSIQDCDTILNMHD